MNPAQWFNLCESFVWFSISLLFWFNATGKLQRRFAPVNISYLLSGVFIVFGLTDLVEMRTGAWWHPGWLFSVNIACGVVIGISFIYIFVKQSQRAKLPAAFYKTLFFLLLTSVFVYTVCRAYQVPIFHDEARTYFTAVSQSVWEICTYEKTVTNNHLLNTLLIKLFVFCFGSSELVIRLPALIGHALYLVGVWLCLKNILSRERLIIGILFLIFNPFMVDLFSSARGYSLGLGFTMLGVYCCMRSIDSSKKLRFLKNAKLALWAFAFATLSNLAFLNVFCAAFLVFAGYLLLNELSLTNSTQASFNVRRYVRQIVPLLTTVVVLALIYSVPIMRMMGKKDVNFWFGGAKGIWDSTIKSLIVATLYDHAYTLDVRIIQAMVALFIIGAGVLIVKRTVIPAEGGHLKRYLAVLMGLVVACSAIITVQWILFKTPFVIERTASYFIPFFFLVIMVVWSCVSMIKNKNYSRVMNGLMGVLVVLYMFNFCRSINFDKSHLSPYDSTTRGAMKYLSCLQVKKGLKESSVSLGLHWIYVPSARYYRERYEMFWLEPIKQLQSHKEYDYYLLTTDKATLKDHHLYQELESIQNQELFVIKRFGKTKSVLAGRL